jgi:hypothetical protein
VGEGVLATEDEAVVTEAALQDWIVGTARLLGWRIFHARVARTAHGWRTAVSYDGAGFPDLVLARDRVLFAEIKLERGRLGPEQVTWLEVLREAGQEVYVWRPSDWTSGGIEAVLRRDRSEEASQNFPFRAGPPRKKSSVTREELAG